jgi:hypothetical protein
LERSSECIASGAWESSAETYPRPTAVADPHQAGDGQRKKSKPLLKLYERTELFWTLLVLVDVVAQACKTANSSDTVIDLLSKSSPSNPLDGKLML